MARGRRPSRVKALDEAICRFGPPDIMHIEHGGPIGPSGHATSMASSTSFAWTDRLLRSCLRIPMDGNGRYRDNLFIERLWRTLNRRTTQRNMSASIRISWKPGHRPARVSTSR